MEFQLHAINRKLKMISGAMNDISNQMSHRLQHENVSNATTFISNSKVSLTTLIAQMNHLMVMVNSVEKKTNLSTPISIKAPKYTDDPKEYMIKGMSNHVMEIAISDGNMSADNLNRVYTLLHKSLQDAPQTTTQSNKENETLPIFSAINSLVPFCKSNMIDKREDILKLNQAKWKANQLEKIALLIKKGHRLDSIQYGMVAWSQLLYDINLDQFYVELICFIHDRMDGRVNFVDQDGRSLLHFAASIFPATEAVKLMSEMVSSGYKHDLKDKFGITALHLLKVNIFKTRLKTCNHRKTVVNMKIFTAVSRIVSLWTIEQIAPKSRYIPSIIQELIVMFIPHDTLIKQRKWEMCDGFVSVIKLVYTTVDTQCWASMLQKQKERLQKIERIKSARKRREIMKAKRKEQQLSAIEKREIWRKRKKIQKKRKKKNKKNVEEKHDVLSVLQSYKENLFFGLVMNGSSQFRQRKPFGKCLTRGRRVVFSRRLKLGYGIAHNVPISMPTISMPTRMDGLPHPTQFTPFTQMQWDGYMPYMQRLLNTNDFGNTDTTPSEILYDDDDEKKDIIETPF